MNSIRWRLVWIGGLMAVCILFLVPRNVEQREGDRRGTDRCRHRGGALCTGRGTGR